MARRKQLIETDSNLIIEQITGFEKEDENFHLCEQFVKSNFKYHRFLDVNSHEITRNIEGLYDKFMIHSQTEKAASFKKLVGQFLDAPDFENRNNGKTDTHYAILSLLIKLADSPTNEDYAELEKAKAKAEEKFDWAAYLLEGEELYTGPFPESPDYSDDEDFAIEDHHVRFQDSRVNEYKPQSQSTTVTEVSFDESSTIVGGGDWLRENLVVQYWKGEVSEDITQSCGHLSNDWECYLSRVSPLYVTVDQTVMTEQQIIREVLWMLSGVTNSHIYEINNNQTYTVRARLDALHLTEDSVKNYLTVLATYGSYFLNLQDFIDQVVNRNGSNGSVCQTYEAFASLLTHYLNGYRKELIDIENIVKGAEVTLTLTSLHTRLRKRFKELGVLHQILTRGVRACDRVKSNAHKASHLLITMYEMLIESDTLGECDSETVTLLFSFWVQTFKPYLDIIDEWISNGRLIDPKVEFLVQRNENIKSLDETFWDTAFTLYCSKTKTDSNDISDSEVSCKSSDVTDTNTDPALELSLSDQWAPAFLKPVLKRIILIGKSMEVLQNLGRLSEVVECSGEGVNKKKLLYETFVEELIKYLGQNAKSITDGDTKSNNDSENSRSTSTAFTDHIKQQMQIKGVYDPLIMTFFSSIFDPSGIKFEPLNTAELAVQRELSCLDLNGLAPIQLAVHRCLIPQILVKYDRVCSKVIAILKDEYKLLYYMSAMRHFYLMEAGDTMYDFYIEIFDKLCLHETWQDASFLNFVLEDALRSHFPDELNRMYVSIEKPDLNPKKRKLPINALDGLTLHYKVPWPVDIVLNSACMKVYNQVFTFLMQIKRTKYCLDKLRFCDLKRENMELTNDLDPPLPVEVISRAQEIHRMHLFRMRLMHFVNSMHNYLMQTILHSTCLKFQDEVEQACDLEEIIRVHNEFIRTLHNRCLLHRSKAVLKEAVMKVLNLVLTFYDLWTDGLGNKSGQTLSDLEAEYSRCSQFLSSFLNTIIKRGYYPHLESLAFALATSTQHSKFTK